MYVRLRMFDTAKVLFTMSEQYFDTINKLDDIAEKLWYYGCPDNEGWGVVSRYLEKHLQDNFWK